MINGETASASPAMAPVNILLVDDESRNLDVLESLLHSPDYNLVRAATAERALMLLLEGIFAVIVLDIQMPDMSGIELAHLIKQRRRTQHIPIIFLTAYYQEDKDVLQGYGSGAVDYLTKPVNPQILRSKIAVFVDLFRKTNALATANAALELEVASRLKAEESLRQINNELESRVAARTADLVRLNDELLERESELRKTEMQVQRELAEQKRVEAALRASEAQLRLVTDYAPVYIAQLDREHRFKFVNRTFARRVGYEPHELIGRPFREVMGDTLHQVFREHIEAAFTGQRVEFETQISYAELGPRWAYVIHEPERTANGDIVGLVAVVTDITERKIAEQEVAAARDQALAASRTKDDFLARLSHELRTPLNPVLLLASEAAANPALAPEVRADFEMIEQNVTLEARLIDDLLDLTAITRGKLALELRSVPVHSALRDALAMMRQEITQKQLKIVLRLAAERQVVRGDDMRLKQIFWNVIKNAVKFTPNSGQIEITSEMDATREVLVIRIADTGIGMTPEETTRIFAAFAQGDHAAQSGGARFGGLGLGLAISRMLVQLHSGSISATSAGRDQGAVFTIELPLSADHSAISEPVNGHPAPAAKPANGASVPTTPPISRILLVEDHEPTCRALAELLSRRNYAVVTANSVAQARASAAASSFDFIISDIGLPDGNGCDLMLELKTQYGLSGIALTGYGMDDDFVRSRAAGFVDHLTKPVSMRALDQALVAILATRPTATTARR